MPQKLVRDFFLILVNISKQPMYASNIFEKRKEDYQKSLEKLAWSFLSNIVPFYEQCNEKQGVWH